MWRVAVLAWFLGISVTYILIALFFLLSPSKPAINPDCTSSAAASFTSYWENRVAAGTVTYAQAEAALDQRLNYCEAHS